MSMLRRVLGRVAGMFAPYNGDEGVHAGLMISMPALRYYVQVVKPHRVVLTFIMMGHIVMSYLFLPSLLLIKYLFDTVIPGGDVKGVFLVAALLMAIGMASTLFSMYLVKVNTKVMTRIIAELRKKMMRSLLGFPTSFFHNEDMRKIHVNVTDGLERLNLIVSTFVSTMFPAAISALGILAFLAYIDWHMFLLVVFMTPLVILVNLKMSGHVQKRFYYFMQARVKYISHTSLLFNFTDLIKSRSTEDREAAVHDRVIEDLRERSIDRVRATIANAKIQELLSNLISSAILVVGGIAVLNGSLSLGNLLMFIVAANMLRGNINSINSGIGSLIEANDSLNRLHRIMMKEDKNPYVGTRTIERVESIEFRGISFGYSGKYILHDINLSISGDEKVAIVGPNGSGKSSLIKLLMGNYRPQEGVILYNGIDAEELDFSDFRRRTGIVPQSPMLWPDTLYKNLTYGVEESTMEEVEEACRIVGLTDFIRKQSKGYESFVGDNGISLSGGERQKIAIARALLGRPMLLILDEPTNHLDQQSIRDLLASIVRLDYKPTILVISHNDAIRSMVDRVVAMDEGRLTPSTEPTLATSNKSSLM
jgi:ATP-binding cassette subfamily B protein